MYIIIYIYFNIDINCIKLEVLHKHKPSLQFSVIYLHNQGDVSTEELPFHFIGMCRMRRFVVVLRSFFHSSLLYTFSCHSSPPTIHPSSPTSSCHLFLGLPLACVDCKFIYHIFWEFYFLPFSIHVQTNVIYVALLSLLR
jgi:hypothetical protein